MADFGYASHSAVLLAIARVANIGIAVTASWGSLLTKSSPLAQ